MLNAETHIRSVIGAVLSAAALLAVTTLLPHPTPVDRALPFVGVIVMALVWLARASRFAPAIEACVPLLAAAVIAAAGDERLRLLLLGVLVAAAFAAAAATVPRTTLHYAGVVLAAVLVLRWVPLADVELWRELLVLAGAGLVLMALATERHPMHLVAPLAVALVTPTHPGKALLYPFVVAAIVFVTRSVAASAIVSAILFAGAFFARASLAPLWFAAALAVAVPLLVRLRVALPAYVAAIALFALWPWSGLVARAMPRFFAAEPASPQAIGIGRALAPSESIDIAVPRGTKRVVVVASGANVARLRAEKVVGSIDDRPLRIGDVADFGFLRREHFFAARNPLPRHPVAGIRGYGESAFLYGAGRIEVRPRSDVLHIAAAPSLPANARLMVESVEFR